MNNILHLIKKTSILPCVKIEGKFVAADAKERLLDGQRKEFLQKTLPEVLRQARLLGIGLDAISEAWQETQ